MLEKADVVVYDSLVGQGILTRIPPDARLINVGKRAGHHMMPQNMINQVLADEAKKGNRVVRLKGGDPFLFGRGGEELELLTKEGVPYEVVPGVTSPISRACLQRNSGNPQGFLFLCAHHYRTQAPGNGI